MSSIIWYKSRARGGFTLAELLIIIAIISVLVAVCIPIFSGQLEKAAAATCAANRRALKGEVSSEYMLGDKSFVVGQVYSLPADTQYTCPDKGVITYRQLENNTFEVYCSKHAPAGMTPSTMDKLLDVLKEGYIDDNNKKQNYTDLDSAADTTLQQTQKYLAALKAAGIDLEAMGVESWRIVPGEQRIEVSTQDITKLNVGDPIVILRFRNDYPAKGQVTYTVWNAKVASNTESGKTYNIIGGTVKQLTTDTDDKTSLDAIKEVYNANNGDAPDLI